MSSHASIHEDESLLSRIDRFYFKLEALLNLAGGIVILALVLLAVVNIVGRKLFNMPVDGYIDWTEQAMAFFALLGIAYCQRLGGHIRMDIVVGSLRGRILWCFEFITTLFTLLVVLVLVYGSYVHFDRAWTNGDSSFDIELPTWPAKLVVPIALSVLSLRLVLQLWGYFIAIRTGSHTPVAVPIPEDVATQASREAEAISDAEGEKS